MILHNLRSSSIPGGLNVDDPIDGEAFVTAILHIRPGAASREGRVVKTRPVQKHESGGTWLLMTYTDSYFHLTMASGGSGNCESYLTPTKEEVARRRDKQDSQD